MLDCRLAAKVLGQVPDLKDGTGGLIWTPSSLLVSCLMLLAKVPLSFAFNLTDLHKLDKLLPGIMLGSGSIQKKFHQCNEMSQKGPGVLPVP